MCERLEALKCNLSPLNKALIVAFATSLIYTYDVRNRSKLKMLNKAIWLWSLGKIETTIHKSQVTILFNSFQLFLNKHRIWCILHSQVWGFYFWLICLISFFDAATFQGGFRRALNPSFLRSQNQTVRLIWQMRRPQCYCLVGSPRLLFFF